MDEVTWNRIDILGTSILGDDVEKFFNEIKQGKYVNAGYGFYLHQLLNSDETQKLKSGDKVVLKNLAKTLYERPIPVFDEDDPLFVEVFGARLTFTVSKYHCVENTMASAVWKYYEILCRNNTGMMVTKSNFQVFQS